MNPDSDGDGVYDGDEVCGWHVFVELNEENCTRLIGTLRYLGIRHR